MSTAATMQQTPVVPPRPSRTQDKDNSTSTPAVPPRPKRFNRSVSPNHDRFAPSPLNESPFAPKSPRGQHFSHSNLSVEAIDRSASVDLPSIGQEGQEYAAFAEDTSSSPDASHRGSSSPEQTRTIGEDVKLHAPKPTMPAQSAKQRVAAVTRTDSDRAASFGIGKPSSEEIYPPRSLKKKASTLSQLSHKSEVDDDHGIPEIGQRVPLLGNAGDIQAPTPGPGQPGTPDTTKERGRHHARRTSGRGNNGSIPPDSYGRHGHGVEHTDKLEKAYYEKHPEAKKFDLYNHHLHDRVKDYHMSSEELNKIVRDTASHGTGFGSTEYVATPSEQVGFQATDEYTSRMSSPRPASAASKRHSGYLGSSLKNASAPDISITGNEAQDDGDEDEDEDVIHVDEHNHRKGFAKFGNEQSALGVGAEEEYEAPILASDEVANHPLRHHLAAAVEPPPERHGSSFEMELPRSRPTSRPSSIYSPPPPELRSTPLDDVEEYEPLFPEDEKAQKKAAAAEKLKEIRQRFPSRDIWEDAPDSVHGTAEVSTPEPSSSLNKPEETSTSIPLREGETPAQAFARRQEELAETEDRSPDTYLQRKSRPRSWAEAQPHLVKEMQSSRPTSRRFPSQDVWEDTPDSYHLQATVSTPQSEIDAQFANVEESTSEKAEKPIVPARPAKRLSGDDKPAIPDRPKPQVSLRSSKAAAESKDSEAVPRAKPAVPARPAGSKIAALQAGFMSDLNKRLQLGPQAPKKEEPKPEEQAEEKEKAPLADARKGRARGPQRRAPTKSSSPSGAPPPVSNGKPVLTFSTTRTLFSINEEGNMTVEQEEEPWEAEAKPKVSEIHITALEDPEVSDDVHKASTEPEKTSSRFGEAPPSSTETTQETKPLATNTAGESILEETLGKKQEGNQVTDVKRTSEDVVS